MVVGNDVLAEWAATRCDDVRIVPTCIEPSEYRRRTAWEIGEVPVVGWIGSPATEPYLVDIADALRVVHERTGARLHVISGGGPPDHHIAAFTTTTAWTAGSVTAIADWDVGIMPLRDGVYERAKCGYKLLQYAASGVPAVASPVGVNRALLDAMDGLAPTTVDEWADALTTMLTEPARASCRARRRGGGRCRRLLLRHVGGGVGRRRWDGELRIVHVITKGDVGGAQTHVVELATAQVAAGHDVTVVAGTGGDAPSSAAGAAAPASPSLPSLGEARIAAVAARRPRRSARSAHRAPTRHRPRPFVERRLPRPDRVPARAASRACTRPTGGRSSAGLRSRSVCCRSSVSSSPGGSAME